MLPSKLQFLWDEERNKKFLTQFLIATSIGDFCALLFILILPKNISYYFYLLSIPIIFGVYNLVAFIYFRKKINNGLMLLITILFLQVLTCAFMAFTGGFKSVSQFTPITLMILAIFMVGPIATSIIASFSVFTLILLFIWLDLYSMTPATLQELFFYLGIYISLAFFLRTLGVELSVQIEARKKLEEVDDLKNQFITLSSHYLRTPLTVINGLMSELDLVADKPNEHVIIEKIKANTTKLSNLTEKFLSISDIEKGTAKINKLPGDINQLVSQCVTQYNPVAVEQKVNLIYVPSSTLIPRFNFDYVKLREVILALLDNAIKYNRAGGSVKVIVQDNVKTVRIDVSDTGVGINKDHLETLFSTFNRGTMEDTLSFNKPGLGLSLYLTKLIVEAHQGKIEVVSNEGQGSTFTVLLPKSHYEYIRS